MRSLAIATALLLSNAFGVEIDSKNPNRQPSSAGGGKCEIEAALGPRLSKKAAIVLPKSDTFRSLELRASSPRIEPTFTAIVEVATEQDVQHTIEYASCCDIPFLAVAGGHGWQSTINNATGGIQINMRKLQQISLNDGGKTVHVGGGVLQKHLVEKLYKLGKQAVSGLCECTSIIGPLMGGGHSALQGFYGFASDNLVSARVVLANGKAVTASAKENSDLFWAMRGAGHNFGIVTSFEINAYDLPKKNWTIVTLIYTQDKLEEFIDALNEVDNQGDHAPELVLAGAITRIPSYDKTSPVVAYQLSYLGTVHEAEPYVKRFRQAGPISVTIDKDVEYKDYYTATNNGDKQDACRTDLNIFGYSISLPTYNKTAMRTGFGYFSDLTADHRYNTSAWLLESYGSRGVWSQDYSASAVPPAERNLPILTVPITWWAGDSTEARERANKYGKLIRTALAAGEHKTSKESHVYLNYAVGSESLGQLYGHEERLHKLKVLKRKYDPENKFRFYMPLV